MVKGGIRLGRSGRHRQEASHCPIDTNPASVFEPLRCSDPRPPSGFVPIDLAGLCNGARLSVVFSKLMDMIGNTLGVPKGVQINYMERRGSFEAYLISQKRCEKLRVRYTVFPSISSVLVEWGSKAWLVMFYCSDSVAFIKYMKELRIDPGDNISRLMALLPMPVDVRSIAKHVVVVYADYPVGGVGGLLPLSSMLLGDVAGLEGSLKLMIGLTNMKKTVGVDEHGIRRLGVRLANLSSGLHYARKAILGTLGIAVGTENPYQIAISRNLLDYVAKGFGPVFMGRDNKLNCLVQTSTAIEQKALQKA